MKQKYVIQVIGKTLFRLSMYFGAFVFSFFAVFGSPEAVKQAFISTDAYERFVPAVIEDSAQNGKGNSSIALDDPEVTSIISESFDPFTLQFYTEAIINSSYDWLNGRQEHPDFIVDFSSNINKMAFGLSELAMSRLEVLPECETVPTTIDPFRDTCKPPYYDFNEGRRALTDDIIANNGIVSKTTFTLDDLPNNEEGQTVVEQYGFLPTVFSYGKFSHWIFLGLMFNGGLLAVYGSRKKREAFTFLGRDAVSTGIFLALSTVFYVFILPRFFSGITGLSGTGASVVLEDVLSKLTTNFNILLIQIGVLISLFGLSILVLERGTKPISKYKKVDKKAGMATSEPQRVRKKDKTSLRQKTIPIQTSEGPRKTGKFQKDKKYRKIPKREKRL